MSVLHHLFNCMCSRGVEVRQGDGNRYPYGTHCVSYRKVKFGVPITHVFTPCESVLQMAQFHPRSAQRLIFTSDLNSFKESFTNHPPPMPLSTRGHGLSVPSQSYIDSSETETQDTKVFALVSQPSTKPLFVALPLPLWELLTYLARAGIHSIDLFRRPGNIQHIKWIIAAMQRGRCVTWSEFNVFTLANVVKRFLIEMPGGLFGVKGELQLLELVDGQGQLEDEWRIQVFMRLLNSLSLGAWQLIVLVFGMWFRMIVSSCANTSHPINLGMKRIADSHSDEEEEQTEEGPDEVSTVSSAPIGLLASIAPERYIIVAEGVAKSVCGSVFHTCRESAMRIQVASQVLQLLILSFPRLGTDAVDFYHLATDSHVPLPTLDVLSPQKRASLMRRASRFALGTLSGAMSRKRSARRRQPLTMPTEREAHVSKDLHSSLCSREVSFACTFGENEVTKEENKSPQRLIASTRLQDLTCLVPPSSLTPSPSSNTVPHSSAIVTLPLPVATPPHSNLVLPRVIVTSDTSPQTKVRELNSSSQGAHSHGLLLTITMPSGKEDSSEKRQSAPPMSSNKETPGNISVMNTSIYRDRFSSIRRRQLELQRKRSEWFLAAPERPSFLSSAISTTSFRSEYLVDVNIRPSQHIIGGSTDDRLMLSDLRMENDQRNIPVPTFSGQNKLRSMCGGFLQPSMRSHLTATSGPDLLHHSGCSSTLCCYSPHTGADDLVGHLCISSARELSAAASSSCMVWDDKDNLEDMDEHRLQTDDEDSVGRIINKRNSSAAITEPVSRRQLSGRRLSENV